MGFDNSLIGDGLARYVNGDAGYIAVLTFFVCEALFNALPYERAKMKQLTSLIVGGVLGFFLLRNASLVDNVLQGILAGGATTIAVAKFKKTSSSDVVAAIASADPVPVVKPVVPVAVAEPLVVPGVAPLTDEVEHL